MKHFLLIKEADSFKMKVQPKDKTTGKPKGEPEVRIRFRYIVSGDSASKALFKKDILAKTNLNGLIYTKDGSNSLNYYSFDALPKGATGRIARTAKGKWYIDTTDIDRFNAMSLHPEVAKQAAALLVDKYYGEQVEDIIDEDITDDDIEEFTTDEESSEGAPF
jgi:hypothetical protein